MPTIVPGGPPPEDVLAGALSTTFSYQKSESR